MKSDDVFVQRILPTIMSRLTSVEQRGPRVSPAAIVRQHEDVTTTGTSYAEITRAAAGYGHIPSFKAFWDDGLRPSFLIIGELDNDTGGATTSLSFELRQFSSGEADIVLLAAADTHVITNIGTTEFWKSSGWISPTISTPTEDHALALLSGKVSAGTGTYSGCALFVRWAPGS